MEETAKSKKVWSLSKKIVSILIAAVSLTAGIIAIYTTLTRDTTNFSHLVISAEAQTERYTEWTVDIDEFIAGFPGGGSCNAEQLAWLEANADPLQTRYTIDMRNSASEGAMLALVDFRVDVAETQKREDIRVRLICDERGTMAEELYFARVQADDPERKAVHNRVILDAPPSSSPEMPVAFNLAPGESGKLVLELFSRDPASGAMQVSVLSRDEQIEVDIEGSEYDVPGMLFEGEMFIFTGSEGPECYKMELGSLTKCTVEDVKHEVDTAMW